MLLAGAGIGLYLIGALSTIYAVMHYALVVTLAGGQTRGARKSTTPRKAGGS